MNATDQPEGQRRTTIIVGAAAAVVVAVVIIVLNERDFDRDPATDTADVVATASVFGGMIIWFLLRRFVNESPPQRLLAAVALGIAIGAAVVGLGSVIWDPLAR